MTPEETTRRTQIEQPRINLSRITKRYINYLRLRLASEAIKADPWLQNQIERHLLFVLALERDLRVGREAAGQ